MSLYIPAGKNLTDPVNRIRNELTLAGNVKSRTTRQSVEDALTGLLGALRAISATPPKGLVCFSGDGDVTVLEPPDPVGVYLYRCESKFVLEPLEAMAESKQLFGLVVMDRGGGTVGLLHGTQIKPLWSHESGVQGKHDAGGQSAHRYERIIEHQAHFWYETVASKANAAFLPLLDELSGIIVGGPGATKDTWLVEEMLDYRLRAKLIVPTFNTGYTDEYQGLKELVAAAGASIQGLEIEKERQVLQRFFAGVRTGESVYGPAVVEAALRSGRVSTLIVTDLTADAFMAGSAAVVVVSSETDEGKRFVGMGGVGALLRWKDGS